MGPGWENPPIYRTACCIAAKLFRPYWLWEPTLRDRGSGSVHGKQRGPKLYRGEFSVLRNEGSTFITYSFIYTYIYKLLTTMFSVKGKFRGNVEFTLFGLVERAVSRFRLDFSGAGVWGISSRSIDSTRWMNLSVLTSPDVPVFRTGSRPSSRRALGTMVRSRPLPRNTDLLLFRV